MNLMFFLTKELKVPEPVQCLHRSSVGATEVQFNKKRDVCVSVSVFPSVKPQSHSFHLTSSSSSSSHSSVHSVALSLSFNFKYLISVNITWMTVSWHVPLTPPFLLPRLRFFSFPHPLIHIHGRSTENLIKAKKKLEWVPQVLHVNLRDTCKSITVVRRRTVRQQQRQRTFITF